MKVLAFFVSLLIRVFSATLRIKHVRVENLLKTPQYILAFWHCHLLMMLSTRYRRPIAVMSSRSKDGEYMVQVLNWFRVETARGSSTRGGSSAMRDFLRKARDGRNLAFTPDGPRGPSRIAKDGVVWAAKATGLPIVPVAFAAKKRKLLRSWDRMVIPFPFTKAILLYGEPLQVPRDGDVEEWRERVEHTMNALADEAERLVED